MEKDTNPTDIQINPVVFDILFADIRTLAEAYQLDDELRTIEQISFSLNDPQKLAKIKSAKKVVEKKDEPREGTVTSEQSAETSREDGLPDADSDSLTAKIKDLVSSRTYRAFYEIESRKFIDAKDHNQLAYFFEMAHKYILTMPRLQLQVAIDFNDQALSRVYAWLEQTIKTKVFLDIVVKPQILAGCAIVYKGVYKDYSLRTQLHENARQIFKPILDTIEKRLIANGQAA